MAVSTDKDGVLCLCHTGTGEVAVAQADTVGMAHFSQNLQQFGGQNGGDVL